MGLAKTWHAQIHGKHGEFGNRSMEEDGNDDASASENIVTRENVTPLLLNTYLARAAVLLPFICFNLPNNTKISVLLLSSPCCR